MKTWICKHHLISFFAMTFLTMYQVFLMVAYVNPDAWFQPWWPARNPVQLERFLMVGNSLRSDILPVLELSASAARVWRG